MLTHYIEISILPDPEFTEPMLISALLSKFHRACVELKGHNLGLSFPQYSLNPKGLGSVVRIHGAQEAVNALNELPWLKGMRDHLSCTQVQAVPDNAEYCTFARKQFKTSAERLRARRMKRKNESYEQAQAHIPKTVERKPNVPFATLRSASTGQTFPLFIEKGKATKEPEKGSFSSYGLSHQTTVPWF